MAFVAGVWAPRTATAVAPSTQAPATEAPSKAAPATEAPGTEVPASEAPAPEVPAAATAAAAKIMKLRADIADSLTQTAYQHRTVVRRREGIYRWDCSGMVAWMLRRAAPAARKALAKERPVARDFYRHIRGAPLGRARNGWQRLAHIQDVRPGDVFAWERPPNLESRSTGHVGFAVEPPAALPGHPGMYTLRILDATSLRHDDDTRPRDGEGGFGEGTILFATDAEGRGTAYGWFGARSRGVIETEVVFGRVSR